MNASPCDPKQVFKEWHETAPLVKYRRKYGDTTWKLRTRYRRDNETLVKARSILLPRESQITVRIPSESSATSGSAVAAGGAVDRAFRKLATQWQEETQYQSSLTEIALHPAYQRIIGMGPVVLPLVLRQLATAGGQWFWALRCITGVDPVRPEDRGNVGAMRKAWIDWAQDKGYTW